MDDKIGGGGGVQPAKCVYGAAESSDELTKKSSATSIIGGGVLEVSTKYPLTEAMLTKVDKMISGCGGYQAPMGIYGAAERIGAPPEKYGAISMRQQRGRLRSH